MSWYPSLHLRGARRMAILPLALLLAACASNVIRSDDVAQAQPQFAEAGKQARTITIALSGDAQKMLPDNLKFDAQKLQATIRRAMEARNLVGAETDSSLPTVEVLVTSIRTRTTFSAIMFGFMAGDDHIKGTVAVRQPSGAPAQRFDVSASYALGGIGGGLEDTRMNWLYETFAKHVLDELTGVKSG